LWIFCLLNKCQKGSWKLPLPAIPLGMECNSYHAFGVTCLHTQSVNMAYIFEDNLQLFLKLDIFYWIESLCTIFRKAPLSDLPLFSEAKFLTCDLKNAQAHELSNCPGLFYSCSTHHGVDTAGLLHIVFFHNWNIQFGLSKKNSSSDMGISWEFCFKHIRFDLKYFVKV
jgi:hypothetical protein